MAGTEGGLLGKQPLVLPCLLCFLCWAEHTLIQSKTAFSDLFTVIFWGAMCTQTTWERQNPPRSAGLNNCSGVTTELPINKGPGT